MRFAYFPIIAAALLLAGAPRAAAMEADQFLTWGVELQDCSEALNRFLNDSIEEFLEKINERPLRSEPREEIVRELYVYLFNGLHSSRIRHWLAESDEVERFPPDSVSFWEYQRMSIYDDLSFPFILPLARTIRVGEVYCGIDQIGHFFGFGRRYYQRYLRHVSQGASEEYATRRAIMYGLSQETSFVGKLVDGIFSHADMEANFQGFRMARDLAFAEPPHLVNEDGTWLLARRVDMRDYVNPDFDESYNVNHYWGLRKRNTLRTVREMYCDKRWLPDVQKRFALYKAHEPSFSRKVITAYFLERGENPQADQALSVICEEVWELEGAAEGEAPEAASNSGEDLEFSE